jgi:hypothetical protein
MSEENVELLRRFIEAFNGALVGALRTIDQLDPAGAAARTSSSSRRSRRQAPPSWWRPALRTPPDPLSSRAGVVP